MSRLIDADALIENVKRQYHCAQCDNYNGVKCRACHVDDEIGDIEDAPTIDAVEVARCKDCRYFEPSNAEEGDNIGYCRNDYAPCQNQTIDAWWFCGSAERVSE